MPYAYQLFLLNEENFTCEYYKYEYKNISPITHMTPCSQYDQSNLGLNVEVA